MAMIAGDEGNPMMRLRQKRAMTAMVVALTIATSALGQSKARGAKGKVRPSATNPVLQVLPVDPAAKRFPAFFVGSPVELIHTTFVGGPERGEFETTAEYEKRKQEVAVAGTYAFQPANVNVNYDADESRFVIKVNGTNVRDADTRAQWTAYEAKILIPELSAMTMRFAKGAERATGKYQLIATNTSEPSATVMVPMEREQARMSKSNLRVMLLFDLRNDSARVVHDLTVRDASKPEDYGAYDFGLAGFLRGVLVYNFVSGDILTRLDAERISPPVPPTETHSAIPLRVGGDVKAPTLTERVEPIYPDVARQARISGLVIVECLIDETGRVSDVRVLKPLPFGLDRAAVDAVKQWKFEPATLNDFPVPVFFNITIPFSLP